MLVDATDKRRRHVAHDLEHLLWVTAVGRQKYRELVQGFSNPLRGDKQHRLLPPVHVNDDRDVVVAALAGRPIPNDSANPKQKNIVAAQAVAPDLSMCGRMPQYAD